MKKPGEVSITLPRPLHAGILHLKQLAVFWVERPFDNKWSRIAPRPKMKMNEKLLGKFYFPFLGLLVPSEQIRLIWFFFLFLLALGSRIGICLFFYIKSLELKYMLEQMNNIVIYNINVLKVQFCIKSLHWNDTNLYFKYVNIVNMQGSEPMSTHDTIKYMRVFYPTMDIVYVITLVLNM